MPETKRPEEVPAERGALRALGEMIGGEMAEAIWDLSAKQCGLRRPVTDIYELRRMAEHIMGLGELTRVAGRSLMIKVVTHEALARPSLG